MDSIIVSRHPAAIEFIARELGGEPNHGLNEAPYARVWVNNPESREAAPDCIPVVAQATPDDVTGRHVYGNLPLHLAALADRVTVIEFTGTPPRGQEYDLAAMDAAGAVLRTYTVFQGTGHVPTPPGGWTVNDLRAALDRAIQEEEQGKACYAKLMEEDTARSIARERAAVARETREANRVPNDRH